MYMLIQINRSQHAFQFLGTFKLILIQSSLHHPYMLPSSCTLTSPSLLSYHYYYLHLITITIIRPTISLIITIMQHYHYHYHNHLHIHSIQSSHYHNCLYNYIISPPGNTSTCLIILPPPSLLSSQFLDVDVIMAMTCQLSLSAKAQASRFEPNSAN